MKDNLSDQQINKLEKYYQDNFGAFSDDVDAEQSRMERWIETLTEEEIITLLKD